MMKKNNFVFLSGEQTVRAALELGIVVGVALMVGLGFMAMVGMELLWDKVLDEYRFVLHCIFLLDSKFKC